MSDTLISAFENGLGDASDYGNDAHIIASCLRIWQLIVYAFVPLAAQVVIGPWAMGDTPE
jgi:hypothetical protein